MDYDIKELQQEYRRASRSRYGRSCTDVKMSKRLETLCIVICI